MRFDSYHPAINLIFFVAVIAFALTLSHPAFIFLGWVCAFAYSVKLNGVRGIAFDAALIPLALAFALAYALNVHFGVTVIAQTVIGNQITMEALAHGLSWGFRVAAVLMWLSCVLKLFTADKVVFLLGKVSPRLSLFVAIILRAIPVVKDRARRIDAGQQGIGRGHGQGGVPQRLVNWTRRVSMIVTWTIERFVQTSDSMRSRGSNLKGRSSYSIYRFDGRDRSLVLFLVLLLTVMGVGIALDQTHILYEPELVFNPYTSLSLIFYVGYAILCLLPLGLQVAGEIRFKSLARGVRDFDEEDCR